MREMIAVAAMSMVLFVGCGTAVQLSSSSAPSTPVAASPTTSPTASPSATPPPLYAADFSDPASNSSRAINLTSLPVGAAATITDGELRLRVLADNARGGFGIGLPAGGANTSTVADARVVGSTATRVFLGCRSGDRGVYRFMVEPSTGRVAIERRLKDAPANANPFLAQAVSQVVKTGDAVNRLRFDCVGDQLVGFVNGERVIQASDTTIDRGTAGVEVAVPAPGQTSEARFDNIVVTAPQ